MFKGCEILRVFLVFLNRKKKVKGLLAAPFDEICHAEIGWA